MPSIAIVAGEASGDASGALLAAEMRTLCPGVQLWGAGGHMMRDAGVELVTDLSWTGAIGIIESLKIVPRLAYEMSNLKKEFEVRTPDVFVPIDFGAFNVRLGAFARGLGVPTVYFFPPGSWRRRQKDHSSLIKAADKIITPFPWSAENLTNAGADAVFLGHPILDRTSPRCSEAEFARKTGRPEGGKVIGLLPGSRPHEIGHIMPALVSAAEIICGRSAKYSTFVIPAASDRAEKMIAAIIGRRRGGNGAKFSIVRNMTYDVMAHSDFLISCSGTATLEAMVIGTPMIIVYRGSSLMKFEYLLRKSILEDFIGMPNIVAGRMICPELLGDEASPEKIADTAMSLLEEPEELRSRREMLFNAKKTLGEPGGTRRAAEEILKFAGLLSKS